MSLFSIDHIEPRDSRLKKKKGFAGEKRVATYLENKGREILERNFTIRGGEIDLIVQNKDYLVCVEVKYVAHGVDLRDYISKRKLYRLQKTFQAYIWKYPTKKLLRIDVVFVSSLGSLQVFENALP